MGEEKKYPKTTSMKLADLYLTKSEWNGEAKEYWVAALGPDTEIRLYYNERRRNENDPEFSIYIKKVPRRDVKVETQNNFRRDFRKRGAG